MKLLIFFITLSLVWGITGSPACADFVYLKNENTVEGIIENEDDAKITLNVGYGKISLEKKYIEYIDRYAPAKQDELRKSWNRRYFMRPEFIPDSLKDIAKDFENLETLRYSAIKYRKTNDTAKATIEKLDKDLGHWNARLAVVSAKLSKLNPEDNLNEYNSSVNEFNSLIANIKLAEFNKNQLITQTADLEQKISAYINEFGLFNKRFRELHQAFVKEFNIQEQNRYFFQEINKKLNGMNDDFTRHSIAYKRYGASITVDCLLNGSVKARLILDTGATLVVISQNIAQRLGADLNNEKSSMLVTLADGQKVKSTPLILESIKVGDVELKKVQTAVIDSRGSTSEEDGLLGMSFLENFLVKLDVKGNKLILEQFNPN
jgi:clan AA aspartic protease (TIGR02281 family)